MRNLSRSGCMVEGLVDVPIGTAFVVDFGEGQLTVASVRRSIGASLGLEFETPLVDDGAGGAAAAAATIARGAAPGDSADVLG